MKYKEMKPSMCACYADHKCDMHKDVVLIIFFNTENITSSEAEAEVPESSTEKTPASGIIGE